MISRHHNLSLPPSAKTYIARQLEMRSAVDQVENAEKTSSLPSNKLAAPSDAWIFKYTPASAQAIKRSIQFQTFLPFLK